MPDQETELSKRVRAIERALLSQGPEYIEKWKEDFALVDPRDFAKLEVIGHKLKGNAKTFGFPILGNLGADLETASRNRSEIKTTEIFNQISNILELLNSSQKNQS